MFATAPGKLILTGEYAVLGGAPALVLAVDRRAVARRGAGPRGSSPFLVAVADAIAARLGADHPAARAALDVVVDTTRFYDGAQKLGLGSSAAVTVAATALALAAGAPGDDAAPLDRERVRAIAAEAHAAAQGALGARGSGADIAAASCGGAIVFTAGAVEPLAWPASVTLVPFFTGQSADTRALVAQVEAAHTRTPAAVDAALAAIAAASRAACDACRTRDPAAAGPALLAALGLAAAAIDDLATATRLPLVPPRVAGARRAIGALGGVVKTTGAGGGDVAIAALSSPEQATVARRLLIQAGCTPLDLMLDQHGVDLQADAL